MKSQSWVLIIIVFQEPLMSEDDHEQFHKAFSETHPFKRFL